MEKKYAEAARRFRQALDASPAPAAPLKTDATIRLADCLYYCGDARSAIDSYSAAIDAGAADADYALLRRATTHGSAGDQEAKIADLKRLRRDGRSRSGRRRPFSRRGLPAATSATRAVPPPHSSFLPRNGPSRPRLAKARFNLAITRHASADEEGAAEAYRQLIRRWPTSEEARMAGDDLRIYTPRGARCRSLRGGSPECPARRSSTPTRWNASPSTRPSALNDDASDTRRLEAYVEDYPDGRYLAQALYDLAEVRHEAKDYEGALAAAGSLIDRRPDSRQAPAALLLKAGILEKRLDGKPRPSKPGAGCCGGAGLTIRQTPAPG